MNVLFPTTPVMTQDYTKRLIGGKTTVVELASGREQRASYWSTPRWEFEFLYDSLSESDFLIISGFMALVKGSWDTFYFRDLLNPIIGQALGTGTGSLYSFQLSRNYNWWYTEYPYFPDLLGYGDAGEDYSGSGYGVPTWETPYIYLDGVLQTTDYDISQTGLLTFTSAPSYGVVVTADFSMYYNCRFGEDSYGFTWNEFRRYESDSLILTTVKS